MIRAAHKFEPKRGIHFSTYAKFWVRGLIRNYLITEFGDNVERRREKIRRADYIQLPDDDVKGNGDIRFSADGLEGRTSDKDMVSKILARLLPQSAAVLRAYYMEGYVLHEIGGQVGVSKEWARQLRNRGVDRAKKIAKLAKFEGIP